VRYDKRSTGRSPRVLVGWERGAVSSAWTHNSLGLAEVVVTENAADLGIAMV
jgi:hypothetical protein